MTKSYSYLLGTRIKKGAGAPRYKLSFILFNAF